MDKNTQLLDERLMDLANDIQSELVNTDPTSSAYGKLVYHLKTVFEMRKLNCERDAKDREADAKVAETEAKIKANEADIKAKEAESEVKIKVMEAEMKAREQEVIAKVAESEAKVKASEAEASKLKAEMEQQDKLDKKTIFNNVTILGAMAMILKHEKLEVITTKAFSLIPHIIRRV